MHVVLAVYTILQPGGRLCGGAAAANLAESEVELQHLVGRVSQTNTRSGLIVSKPKTEVQCAGKGRPHCASYQSTSQQPGIRIASSLTQSYYST